MSMPLWHVTRLPRTNAPFHLGERIQGAQFVRDERNLPNLVGKRNIRGPESRTGQLFRTHASMSANMHMDSIKGGIHGLYRDNGKERGNY